MRVSASALNHFTEDKIFKPCHLYELSLCALHVTSESNTSTTTIRVDNIDLCFVGMILAFGYFDEDTNSYFVVTHEVTNVSPVLSQLTFASPVSVVKNQIIVETLYNETPMPVIRIGALNTVHNYLEFNHAFFGTFSGKLLFTDFDIPIIINAERPIFQHLPEVYGVQYGPTIYVPFPIGHKEVSIETNGRMNTAEISAGNINQELGAIAFQHNSFRKREVAIKTAFLEFGTVASLGHLMQKDATTYVMPSRTQSNQPVLNLNEGFFDCIYANNSDVMTEFFGSVNNINIDDEQVNVNAIVATDDTENVRIPTREYTRTHCPFTYKSWRCRFRSHMLLNIALNDSALTMECKTTDKFYYFRDMTKGNTTADNETYVIQVDNEQIVINAFLTANTKSNEEIRAMKKDLPADYEAQNTVFTLQILQRGANGTVAANHAQNATVDIVYCRKTEHDCMLHGHDAFFGAFPSIPKNRSYGAGY
ncbi:MAG: hypothetical protein PHX51_08235 [Clostridia bacterium]|nr:hypothetical protein [Clostridia bacterium]